MAQKLVVIVAVTGRQGSSVANTFLAEGSWKVRGLTRNLESESAKALQAKGVQLVKADLNSVDSLAAAFEGATLIFGVTDFWSNLGDQSLAAKVNEHQTIFDLAAGLELQHGTNLVDAVAKTKGLQRFVFSSLPDPHAFDSTHTKYENLRHVFEKPKIEAYLAKTYPDLEKITSIVYLSYYFENWNAGYYTSPKKGEDGKLHIYYPFDGTTKFAHTAASIDTGSAVLALSTHKPGVKVFLTSEYLDWNTYLEAFSEATGIPNGGVINIGKEGVVNAVPGPLGSELYENFLLIEDLSTAGNPHSWLTPQDIGVKKTTTLKEFLAKTDLSSLKN